MIRRATLAIVGGMREARSKAASEPATSPVSRARSPSKLREVVRCTSAVRQCAPRRASRSAASKRSAAASLRAAARYAAAARGVVGAIEMLGMQRRVVFRDTTPRRASAARGEWLCSSDAYAPSRMSACTKPKRRASASSARTRSRPSSVRGVVGRIVEQMAQHGRDRSAGRSPPPPAPRLVGGGRRSRRLSTTLWIVAGIAEPSAPLRRSCVRNSGLPCARSTQPLRHVGMRGEVRARQRQRIARARAAAARSARPRRRAASRRRDRPRAASCRPPRAAIAARRPPARRRQQHPRRGPVHVLDEQQRAAGVAAARMTASCDARMRPSVRVALSIASYTRRRAAARRGGRRRTARRRRPPRRRRARDRGRTRARVGIGSSGTSRRLANRAWITSRPCAAPKSSTARRVRGATARRACATSSCTSRVLPMPGSARTSHVAPPRRFLDAVQQRR